MTLSIWVGVCNFSSKIPTMFKVAEIQQIFYNLPRESTVENWRTKAGENFVFSFKVFQGITHPARSPTWRKYRKGLNESEKDLVGDLKINDLTRRFWEKMFVYAEILNAKFLVVQMPPSFAPTQNNIKNFEETYNYVIDSLNKLDSFIALELRGEWLKNVEYISRLLSNKDRVLHVTDPFFNKPVEYRSVAYFRLHGIPYLNYKYVYTDEDFEKMVKFINSLEDEGVREAYFLFNNVRMLDSANRFKKFLEGLGSWRVF